MKPKMKRYKKGLLISSCVFFGLALILCIHIYIVTKPKVDANTLAMARIYFKQSIDQQDAEKITAWLYHQNGVDHVFCNKDSRIAVFTYYPFKTNASAITDKLSKGLNYKAERIIPTREELQNGCPAMAHSYSAKIYSLIKNIF